MRIENYLFSLRGFQIEKSVKTLTEVGETVLSLNRLNTAVKTMTIRSFIGLPLLKNTANELGDVAAKMSYQDKSNAVRWVDQENYHITLAFLGEQSESQLEFLAEQLDSHIASHEFQLELSHLSPFPATKPKLVAAMAQNNEDLNQLHQQVISAINASNMLIDKRKFIPHVTLGRYRHSRNSYAGSFPLNVLFDTIVEEVVLYESVLSTAGAEYQPIYRFPLDEYDSDYMNFDKQYDANEFIADEG